MQIPESLRTAHYNGQTALIIGAGASMGSGLPNFKKLTCMLLNDFSEALPKLRSETVKRAYTFFEKNKYDRALQSIESEIREPNGDSHVRRKLEEFLDPNDRCIDNQKILARLAWQQPNRVPIVTTNFETTLEYGAKQEGCLPKTIETAPRISATTRLGWPMGKLIYLHGRLAYESTDDSVRSDCRGNLVLTAPDFGSAYLRDQFAARFITSLTAHRHVIFIGYSLNDVMMRYLMDALADQRGTMKQAYIFLEDTEDDQPGYHLSGLTEVLYPKNDSHSGLWNLLDRWSKLPTPQEIINRGLPKPGSDDFEISQEEFLWAMSVQGLAAR